jgi:hypothetical protein
MGRVKNGYELWRCFFYVNWAINSATEPSAKKWNGLCKVKDAQICTLWMMIKSSSINVGKGTCKNVNTPRGEKKMLNWGRMCVSREWVHGCIYNGVGGIIVYVGSSMCRESVTNIFCRVIYLVGMDCIGVVDSHRARERASMSIP